MPFLMQAGLALRVTKAKPPALKPPPPAPQPAARPPVAAEDAVPQQLRQSSPQPHLPQPPPQQQQHSPPASARLAALAAAVAAAAVPKAEAEARDTELLEEAIWGDVLPSVRQLREQHPGVWGAEGGREAEGRLCYPLWCCPSCSTAHIGWGKGDEKGMALGCGEGGGSNAQP